MIEWKSGDVMGKNSSRRSFLKKSILGIGAAVAAACVPEPTTVPTRTGSPTTMPTPTGTSLPAKTPSAVVQTPVPTPSVVVVDGQPTVVHVRDLAAVKWDEGDPLYWKYADQGVVDALMECGMLLLTGENDLAAAWKKIIPAYQPGDGIAIKVNFNTCSGKNDEDQQIDAIIEPVNSVIAGLITAGVKAEDIWVYDASRPIPDRFSRMVRVPEVRFFDNGAAFSAAGFNRSDDQVMVKFSTKMPPLEPGRPAVKITDLLVTARYLINMPLLKKHSTPGFTLGFKNHFGSINHPGFLHDYIGLDREYFSPDYNPLVDIFQNPNVGAKTVLTIGDGIFGYRGSDTGSPSGWDIFQGKYPASLFLSQDPVAIDCVMGDFIAAERGLSDDAFAYLKLASELGLGVFDRSNQSDGHYQKIHYLFEDMTV